MCIVRIFAFIHPIGPEPYFSFFCVNTVNIFYYPFAFSYLFLNIAGQRINQEYMPPAILLRGPEYFIGFRKIIGEDPLFINEGGRLFVYYISCCSGCCIHFRNTKTLMPPVRSF